MSNPMIAALEGVNRASAFNDASGFIVAAAEAGAVSLKCEAMPRLLNHAGALHAGVQAAMIDTACGYAAGTLAGNVVTLSMNLQFLASAKGERFEARARVVKAGKAQVFAEARLFAFRDDQEVEVASGTAVLTRIG